MSELAGFSPKIAALVVAVAAAYFLLSWAPLIWPLASTHKVRHTFPRRYLFAAVVFVMSYGLVAAFLCVATLPLTAYSVFVAPQLAAAGFHLTDPLVRANGFVADYWWVLLPPTLLLSALWLVRRLAFNMACHLHGDDG
jgi:hypothetical protein